MQEHGNLDSINLNAQMSYKNKIHSINSKKEYSLHLDAKLLGDFLENEVVKKNIEIIDAIVVDTKTNSNDDIVELSLDNGTSISLDFLIDASGFSRLFLDNVYNSAYHIFFDGDDVYVFVSSRVFLVFSYWCLNLIVYLVHVVEFQCHKTIRSC